MARFSGANWSGSTRKRRQFSIRAAFFDVDGTLTTTRVWDGLMEYFRRGGFRRFTHGAFWVYHTPFYLLKRFRLISEGAFRRPWGAHLGWYFRGYGVEEANSIWNWVVEEFLVTRWRVDIRRQLDRHLEAGDLVVLVSGGPLPLLQRIAAEMGVEHVVGTQFEVRNGHYSGRSTGLICIDENKAILTRTYLQQLGGQVDYPNSHAYADSISDLPLLEMVGHPAAVYPDEKLKQVAQSRGWKIFPS